MSWFNFPKTILDSSDPRFARWFKDGTINITYNMFDRYLKDHSTKKALIWVSNMVNDSQEWTLREAYEEMCKMALLLR